MFVVRLSGNWRVELTGGGAPGYATSANSAAPAVEAVAARLCNFGKINGPKAALRRRFALI
jgi:hypothetical protein